MSQFPKFPGQRDTYAPTLPFVLRQFLHLHPRTILYQHLTLAMIKFRYWSQAMDSLHEKDASSVQIASALPFNVVAGGTGSLEQIAMEPHTQEALRPHPGLPRRKQFSKEEWEAQRPLIRQLYYLDERPYEYVIHILGTKHNFFPTYVFKVFGSS